MPLLKDEYWRVRAQLRESSPRYAALTQPQPLTVEELRRQVLDDDAAGAGKIKTTDEKLARQLKDDTDFTAAATLSHMLLGAAAGRTGIRLETIESL